MKTNFAKTYSVPKGRTVPGYNSYYTSIEGFEQILFYWNTEDNIQLKLPVWRNTRQPITYMAIISADDDHFTIAIRKKQLVFVRKQENEFKLSEESKQVLESISWLEKEMIISSTTNSKTISE